MALEDVYATRRQKPFAERNRHCLSSGDFVFFSEQDEREPNRGRLQVFRPETFSSSPFPPSSELVQEGTKKEENLGE
jgi:hypothetical protein